MNQAATLTHYLPINCFLCRCSKNLNLHLSQNLRTTTGNISKEKHFHQNLFPKYRQYYPVQYYIWAYYRKTLPFHMQNIHYQKRKKNISITQVLLEPKGNMSLHLFEQKNTSATTLNPNIYFTRKGHANPQGKRPPVSTLPKQGAKYNVSITKTTLLLIQKTDPPTLDFHRVRLTKLFLKNIRREQTFYTLIQRITRIVR